MASDTLVLFRTHFWTDWIEMLARRLYGAAAGLDFAVLADETRGRLDIPACFDVVRHTDDFSAFGLPAFPKHAVLWYNADYTLYLLRQRFPDKAYFVLVEYDVAANIDIYAMMEAVRRDGVDFVAAQMRRVDQTWPWYRTIVRAFDETYGAFIPFMVASARAADAMLQRRVAWNEAVGVIQSDDDWPFCEGFLGSAVEQSGLRWRSLEDFVDLTWFRFRPAVGLAAPEVNRQGTLVHPVLSGSALYAKLFDADIPPFSEIVASVLESPSYQGEAEGFVRWLFWRLRALGRRDDVRALSTFAERNGWTLPPIVENLAFGKPASQSSTCEFSVYEVAEEDARLGNGPRAGGIGFHTAFETDPWWQVDLQQEAAIQFIDIYNRLDLKERCTRLAVLISFDGERWTLVASKLTATTFGGADGKPYSFSFDPPVSARFVRIQMLGEGFFHLDQVEIFADCPQRETRDLAA